MRSLRSGRVKWLPRYHFTLVFLVSWAPVPVFVAGEPDERTATRTALTSSDGKETRISNR